MLKWILVVSLLSSPAYADYGPYTADLIRVIDGDTVVLKIHVWPEQYIEAHVRVDGVDTPEKHSRYECEKIMANKATAFTKQALDSAQVITVKNVSLGKYAGRVLGRIEYDGKDLGQKLISSGLAREYHGGHRSGWCQ